MQQGNFTGVFLAKNTQGNTEQEDANVPYIRTHSGIRRRDPTVHMAQSYMHLYDTVYFQVN